MRGSRLAFLWLLLGILTVGLPWIAPTLASSQSGPTKASWSDVGAVATVDSRTGNTVVETQVTAQLQDAAATSANIQFSQATYEIDADGNWNWIGGQFAYGSGQLVIDLHLATAHLTGSVFLDGGISSVVDGMGTGDQPIDASWAAATPVLSQRSTSIISATHVSRSITKTGSTYRYASAKVSVSGQDLGVGDSPTGSLLYNSTYSVMEHYFGGHGPGSISGPKGGPKPVSGPQGGPGPSPKPVSGAQTQPATISGPVSGPVGSPAPGPIPGSNSGSGGGSSVKSGNVQGFDPLKRNLITNGATAGADGYTWNDATSTYDWVYADQHVWDVQGTQTSESDYEYVHNLYDSWSGQMLQALTLIAHSGTFRVTGLLDKASYEGTLSGQSCAALDWWEMVCVDASATVEIDWTGFGTTIKSDLNHTSTSLNGDIQHIHLIDMIRQATATVSIEGTQPLNLTSYGWMESITQNGNYYAIIG